MSEMYCCGYCGGRTNKEGDPIEFIHAEFDNSIATQVHGTCCADQYHHEQEMMTREMMADE